MIPIHRGCECCETSIFEDSGMVINKFTEVHFLSPFPQMYGKISSPREGELQTRIDLMKYAIIAAAFAIAAPFGIAKR